MLEFFLSTVRAYQQSIGYEESRINGSDLLVGTRSSVNERHSKHYVYSKSSYISDHEIADLRLVFAEVPIQ